MYGCDNTFPDNKRISPYYIAGAFRATAFSDFFFQIDGMKERVASRFDKTTSIARDEKLESITVMRKSALRVLRGF